MWFLGRMIFLIVGKEIWPLRSTYVEKSVPVPAFENLSVPVSVPVLHFWNQPVPVSVPVLHFWNQPQPVSVPVLNFENWPVPVPVPFPKVGTGMGTGTDSVPVLRTLVWCRNSILGSKTQFCSKTRFEPDFDIKIEFQAQNRFSTTK